MGYEDDILAMVQNGKVQGHRYWMFVLEYKDCASCGKHMLNQVFQRPHYIFPAYLKVNAEKQREVAGFEWQSGESINDDPICQKCASEGKASFRCQFCGEQRTSDLKYDCYPDGICTVCAETLSKKEWDEKMKQWEHDHRYDNY